MPNSSTSPEATSIEEAYEVKALFKTLFDNLIDEPNTEQSVAKFTAGLNTAKRARDLALNVVQPSSSARRALRQTRTKPRRKA